MLRSRDFRDQLAIETQLRGWHNRALHNTFGLSLGLGVSPVPASGPLEAVRVTCGLAYDCFGRELILQDAREIAVPPAPQGEPSLTLLIRYKETSRFPKRAQVEGGCLPGPCSPFEEEPEFMWKFSDDVQVVDGVPLARVKYDDTQTPRLHKECAAPISRPLARPHIARGATIPGNTRWNLWFVTGWSEYPIGVQTMIDTSPAGFTETPCYFAWLQGPLWEESTKECFPAPFAHIDLDTATEFTFRLWLPALPISDDTATTTNQDFATKFFAFAQKQKLFVCWLGIQSESEGVTSKEVNHGNT